MSPVVETGFTQLVSALAFFGAGVLGAKNYFLSRGITNYWMLFSVGMFTAGAGLFTVALNLFGILPDIDVILPSLLTSAHTAIILSALDMLTSNIKRTAA